MDTIGRVRRAYWVQKKKIKAIARELRLSRGTVRRIVRSGETVLSYERKEQPLPKLGPFVEQLDKLLEANMAKRKRERLTTKRLTEQLKEAGYAGGYDSVRRYALAARILRVTSFDVCLRDMTKPHDLLVPVSSVPYSTSTPGLSTSWSTRGL